MASFFKGPLHLWWRRPGAHACAIILLLALFSVATSTQVSKTIVPHNFVEDSLPLKNGSLLKGRAIVEVEAGEPSFVQGGKGSERDMWVGLLDQEYVMQSSHALVLAFKRGSKTLRTTNAASMIAYVSSASKYIYSAGFLRQLFVSNSWLRYSILSMEEKLAIVKNIEKITNGSKLRYWNKPQSAVKLMAKTSLAKCFPLRSRLIGAGRRSYQKHYGRLTEALTQAKAGSAAMDLILASKTLPMYSWTQSFFNHPITTLQNTIIQSFEDAVGGVSGLYSSEVKSSCFSFAYRVNSIMPYTAAYPGGILGDIMKGLVRSYFLVFQQSLVNFKGIFALLIGVICKMQIIQLAVKAIKPLFRIARKGLRAIQAFRSKTIAMRGDPVGQGLIDRMMKREAVVLTTILFQLHAVDVEKQYREAENVNNALTAGGGSWSTTEGLFIGAAEFGRAFQRLVDMYRNSAEAYVNLCKALSDGIPEDFINPEVSEDSIPRDQAPQDRSSKKISPEAIEAALEFFPAAHPEVSGADEQLSMAQKVALLQKSCRKHRAFVMTYQVKRLYYVQRVIQQMVRILRYYFKYFKGYISDVLSIFYETALAILETKVNDSAGTADGVTSPAEEMVAAEARAAARKSAAQSALDEGQLPRKLFRATKFAEESQSLAHGLFDAAGGFSLFRLSASEPKDPRSPVAREAALRLLTSSEASMRKGVGQIYQRFLNSQILLSRVEKNKKRLRVFDFIAKCRTSVEEKTQEEKDACGTIVTSEIDEDEFISKALFAVNLAISGPSNDIAFESTGQATDAFAAWAQHATTQKKKTAAGIASRNADQASTESFVGYLRQAALEKLTFRRFEHVEKTRKLILYDENGRSLTFTANDENEVKNLVSPARDTEGKRIPKPDPLDCTSQFTVTGGNEGVLEFFLAAGQRAGEGEPQSSQSLQAVELKPAIQLKGTIEYNDDRKELADIQNDPNAIRDTIVAHLVEKRGRVAAETMAGILSMLHRRLPIFWKRSPVEFLQHLTPKMFFDAISILAAQPYDQAEATVVLDGKLYTFPKSFTALKDIVLSSINRAIIRMHSLSAYDAALLIAMGSLHFAYKKIQKHRTGRTATMHLFLKEVNHIMGIYNATPEELNTLYNECAFFANWEAPREEDVIKCAIFRYMKIGSLKVDDEIQPEILTYVTAFVTKLSELKGTATWKEYLNLDYFSNAAKMYGKTAAKYKYEVLHNQLNDIPGTEDEASELAILMKKLHPSLSGHRPPRPKKKQGFLKMLRKFKENLPVLPSATRRKVSGLLKNCLARMRRFIGSRRSWFYGWKISPKVIQGPHFMGALKAAEVTTYPDADIPRQVFIEVDDLQEFGKVLLSLETIAATLDSPTSMYNTVTQLRSTPTFTPAAKEQYDRLARRAKQLGVDVVKVAAGWLLKAASGYAGVNMALGLLGLLDPSGKFVEKALQLRYLTSEALAFLDSSLDLAYLLLHAPEQTKDDVSIMRFYMHHGDKGSFMVKAQCEPRGLGINTAEEVQLVEAIKRLENVLEKQPGFLEGGTTNADQCEQFVTTILKKPLSAATSIPHDVLLASPDAFGLCYLLLKLRSSLAEGAQSTTVEKVLQNVYVDKLPLSAHLEFLQQRSANLDDRKARAKFISSLLRHLLMATVENLGDSLGGISFKSYDGEAKTLSFQYTLQDSSPPGAPGPTLAYAADLLLGTPNDSKRRFVAFSFEGPQFLMEWYRYLDGEKLRKFTDDVISGQEVVTYRAMSKLSNVYTVTDLADLAYSLRQSSKVNAAQVARTAALTIMEGNIEPALRRYGLANMVVDLVRHAELVKKECIKKVLDNYESYSASTLLEKEMFKYDCFYSQITESQSFADVARAVTEDDIQIVMDALDSAYEHEAHRLYELLVDSEQPHSTIAHAAFQAAAKLPVTGMVDALLPMFLSWLRERRPWKEVVPILQAHRLSEWVATPKTSSLGRPVTQLEHPKLMNPYQILIDVMLAATTGSPKRRRFPVVAPFKRIKAFYAMVKPDRKSRAATMADLQERDRAAEEAINHYNEELQEGRGNDNGPFEDHAQ